MRNRRKRRWIGKAVKRPGALRRKFARWYGLKADQKIPRKMYLKGLRRSKRRGDTRTMREINLAMTLGRLRRRKSGRRRGRVIRGVSFRARRRVAANPWSKGGRWIEPTEVIGPYRDRGGKLYWRVPGSTTRFRSYRTASHRAVDIARRAMQRDIRERKDFLGA